MNNDHLASSIKLEDCWAKTDPETGLPCLSVMDHCVNVGAVSKFIEKHLAPSCRGLVPLGSATLCAAHDIGKISPGFLMKSPIWREQWQQALGLSSPDQYEPFHAKISHYFLAFNTERPLNWLVSIGGHHGTYTSNRPQPRLRNTKDHPSLIEGKGELLDELTRFFGPLPTEPIERAARLHWFTGMMIFSDWVGSNIEWFPLHATSKLTLETATNRAEAAIEAIGWHRRAVSQNSSFESLFGFTPNPLQKSLLQATDTRGLYIVEAPMGVGKTEAALALAYDRWTLGDERGLYFALPTQLTSNRIHERVSAFLNSVIIDSSTQALIHSNAKLRDDRITPLFATAPDSETRRQADTANQWFSDSRKALIAPFGTGTIDQALMAVLPVKFAALRLFALAGKVIVIDEVHSYDPYTSAYVDRAVKWLLETGCTVVILSATLTAQRRAELVAATGATETDKTDAYPLITKVPVGSTHAEHIPVLDAAPASKEISIEKMDLDASDWIDTAVAAAENGACVLVIRNTVATAQSTYQDLKCCCRDGHGIEFGLIHSRFPQFQRNFNESKWTEQLGRSSKNRPKGAILVGTQVLEQSIDIDADILMTDIAPTDLLLQRIGRLHRHPRVRPPGYERAHCILLQRTVDWNDDPKNIKEQIGTSAFIYPPIALYQSTQTWNEIRTLTLPEQIRPLLKATQLIPEKLPSGAQHFLDEYLKVKETQKNAAWTNDVFNAPSKVDTEGAQTRWKIQPSAMVVLLRAEPIIRANSVALEFLNGKQHRLHLGRFDFKLARLLHLNAVRVPRYIVADQLQPGIQPDWLDQHLPQSLLAICERDNTTCRLADGTESPAYTLSYHQDRGLSHVRNKITPSIPDHDDESWF